jgi:hypothetical protein
VNVTVPNTKFHVKVQFHFINTEELGYIGLYCTTLCMREKTLQITCMLKQNILSRVRGFVTNNNGFWICWLDLFALPLQSLIRAHNLWLSKTRSMLSWTKLIPDLLLPTFITSREPDRAHRLQGFHYSCSCMLWVKCCQIRGNGLVKRHLTMDHSGFHALCHNIFTSNLQYSNYYCAFNREKYLERKYSVDAVPIISAQG